MKFTLTIFLGLGLSAAIASDEANLRANAHSRQLANSQEASGGVWMYYLMLNAIAAPIDRLGFACGQSVCNQSSRRELWGSDGYSSSTSSATSTWGDDTYSASSNSTSSSGSSSSVCPVRCHKAPHLKPPHPKPKRKSKKNNGGKKSGSGSNSTWADDGNGSNGWADDGNGGNGWSDDGNGWADDGYHRDSSGGGDDDKSSENGGGSWYNDDGNSEEVSDENDDGNGGGGGDDNFVASDDAESTQYLSNNGGNGNGNAQAQINSGKSMPVWPFLVAALTVGVVAAALMAKKRKQARRGNHALNGSIQRRMQLFSGGVPRKEKPAAERSLYENDYENEPSFVEMRDPDDR